MSVAISERNGVVSVDDSETQKTVSTDTIETSGRKHTEITVGSRVWVTGYCPFRGLRGSVLQVHLLEERRSENIPDEPLHGVYQVQLDEVSQEPIEFHSDDIDLLTPVAIRE